MALLLAVLGALLLSGCGGGGGGSPTDVIHAVQTAAAMRLDLLFCYFGVSAPLQIKQTLDHVNTTFIMAWGENVWHNPDGRAMLADSVIRQLQESVANGVTKVVLGVDFLIFDAQYHYRGSGDLFAFVERLKALQLWDYVVALYPVDEPDLHLIDNDTMDSINTALRLFGKPIATIYTDRKQWPGIKTCDWVGFDKYGTDVHGDGVLQDMKARLNDRQRIMLVTGGCDPWRDNVRPVLDYANSDPQVVMIVAFIYGDHWGGTQHLGIQSNGMLPEYAAVGRAILGHDA